MEGWQCWERVSEAEARRPGLRRPIATRWVDVNKGDAASPDVRARLVAKDFAAKRDDAFFAATPPLEALRLLISDMTSRGGKGEAVRMMILDAKKAHLHAAAARELYVQLPEEAGGGYARLLRALYGTRNAPALWESFAAAQLEALGFRRGRANSCVYVHARRGLRCLIHGDDFVFTGLRRDLEWVHRELARTILLKRVGILGPNVEEDEVQELRVLNRVLRLDEHGVRYEADPRHAEILAAMLSASTAPISTPGVRASQRSSPVHDCRNPPSRDTCLDEVAWSPEEEEEWREGEVEGGGRYEDEVRDGGETRGRGRRPGRRERVMARQGSDEEEEENDDETALLDASEVTLFRATAARANYLALDRADLAYAAKELCRRMAAPRVCDRQALRRLCRYLLGAPRLVCHYRWQEPGAPLRVYCDTDFAGCPWTRKSTSGGCAMRGSHLLKHWAVTQKAITLSSGEAELGGLVKGASEGIGLQSLAADLDIGLKLELHADSAAAIGICRRSGIGRVRHLAVGQLWIQERLREGTLSLFKVAGPSNPADLLTKHLASGLLTAHLSRLGALLEGGRAGSAPRVSAEIQAWLHPHTKQ